MAADPGYGELAFHAVIGNLVSLQAHLALGFTKVERAIHLRKSIPLGSAKDLSPTAKMNRFSVAVVVRRDGDSRFLAVRRPPDDELLPDVWGLPAVTLKPGEFPEAGTKRIGLEKLGVELEPLRFLGARCADRGDYVLILADTEARVLAGEPNVFAATSQNTRYVDQQWTNDLTLLRPAASRGSLCCQILLDSAAISY